MEVQAGFEPADNGVADRGLTTWLLHQTFDRLNIIAEDFWFVKCFFILFYAFGLQKCAFYPFALVNPEKICYNKEKRRYATTRHIIVKEEDYGIYQYSDRISS